MKAGLFILGGLGAVAAAVATIPDDIANRSPTHIIKFKRKPTNVTSTFARDFIATKHREYILAAMLNKQSKAKKSKREQEEDEDEGGDAEDEIEAQDFDDEEDDEAVYAASIERQFALDAIDIGPDFIALAGVFPDKDFIDLLHVEEDIDYVEVNQMYKATLIPPYHDQVHRDELKFLQQENLTKRNLKLEKSPNWGLSRINQRLLSDFDSYEYDETAGQGVDVFVLDTGVYTGHSDFEGRAVTVANLVEQEDDNDMGGHGTHVASKIAGKVHGVAKAANIRSVKILNQHGDGSTSVLIKGISEIIKNHTAGKTVVNLSLSGPRSRIIDEALSKLVHDYNIPVFASAGNAENDACYFSPSANADVFAVGATDSKDQVASYSNTGSCVDIYAPGSDIKSAWIGSADSTMNLDGTSMASPHVAGIAANLMSKGSFRSAAEIYNALTLAATNGVLTFEDSDNTNNHNLLAYNTR